MATIYDVARIAGVSISTVSLAFSDKDRVSPEKHRRIQEAARAIGYVPNPVARSLQSGRTRLIAMVVGDVSNPFLGRVLHEVERCAWEEGYLVIVCDSGDDPAREHVIIDQLRRQRVAGMILFSSGGAGQMAHLTELRAPLVLVDQKYPGLPFDFVGSDNELASSLLTRHLVELGHTRIGYVGGPERLPTARQRLAGFMRTMEAAGLAVDPALVRDGDYRAEAARQVTLDMLRLGQRPTAILAANNVMGLGVLQAIKSLGLRCPEQISLTCIDTVPWAEAWEPTLTTVVQAVDQMGRIATECLLERISAPPGTAIAPRDYILTPQFIRGGSSAVPPRQAVSRKRFPPSGVPAVPAQ